MVNRAKIALTETEVLAKVLNTKERLALIVFNLILSIVPGSVLVVDLADAESVPEPILAEGLPYPFLAEYLPCPLDAEHVAEPYDPAVVGIAGHKVLKNKAGSKVKKREYYDRGGDYKANLAEYCGNYETCNSEKRQGKLAYKTYKKRLFHFLKHLKHQRYLLVLSFFLYVPL